ncbi:hypothetical protein GUJ93_ZPchr0001g32405 [Zizania palustris]|uniref:Disease resistance N-terminal domain-containing protein n=1 Tax=Zizania palustris TaxID=103762 RepID=A0A8J5RXR5_ZIZPA|nr:hypothetical protein GUJ93_ZPchr0001g32405 [Zizania palustris]
MILKENMEHKLINSANRSLFRSKNLTMEAFFSAVLGDLLSRSISFVIDRYCWQQQEVDENLHRLLRVLLRIQAIVEEADGRCITNQAMLLQLRMVRDVMYRGYYFLDNFRYRLVQPHDRDEVGDHNLLDPSHSSPSKRFCLSTRTRGIMSDVREKKEMQKMLGHLESIVSDMQEFIVFVSNYPRVNRQPYCSYLLLENCMFGRQAEQERVINFLLEPHPPGDKGIDVLPIIGPGRVGKSTLVEHVCLHERVRKYFSTIVLYCTDSIEGGELTSLTDACVIKHRNPASTKRSLLIIELDDDMDEGTWRRTLHNLRRDHMPPVSKIIITGRSMNIAAFGTTEALELDFLPKEAYWYFFKTIAFGSTNPEDEPKLASIGMEIATLVNGSFMAMLIFSGLLRSNLSVQFWYRFLQGLKYFIDRYFRLLGEDQRYYYKTNNGLSYIWTHGNKFAATMRSHYQASSAHLNDLHMMRASDVFTKDVKLQGKFEILEWQSTIPPYYSYLTRYEILERPPHMLPERKRSRQLSKRT